MDTLQNSMVVRVFILLVFVLLYQLVNLTTAVFWLVFLLWLLYRLPISHLAGAAIALLISIPMFIYMDNQPRAEQVAVYVYYLLVIIVVLQIGEYIRESKMQSGKVYKVESPKVREAPKLEGIKKAQKKKVDEKPKTKVKRVSVDGIEGKVKSKKFIKSKVRTL